MKNSSNTFIINNEYDNNPSPPFVSISFEQSDESDQNKSVLKRKNIKKRKRANTSEKIYKKRIVSKSDKSDNDENLINLDENTLQLKEHLKNNQKNEQLSNSTSSQLNLESNHVVEQKSELNFEENIFDEDIFDFSLSKKSEIKKNLNAGDKSNISVAIDTPIYNNPKFNTSHTSHTDSNRSKTFENSKDKSNTNNEFSESIQKNGNEPQESLNINGEIYNLSDEEEDIYSNSSNINHKSLGLTKKYTRGLQRVKDTFKYFKPSLEASIPLNNTNQILLRLSSFVGQQPSVNYLNSLIEKFDQYIHKLVKDNHNHNNNSKVNTKDSIEETISTRQKNDDWIKYLRSIVLLLKDSQLHSNMKNVIIKFFINTSQDDDKYSINDKFLSTFRIGEYLCFWKEMILIDKSLYETAKARQETESFFYLFQYIMSDKLQNYYKKKSEKENLDKFIKSIVPKKVEYDKNYIKQLREILVNLIVDEDFEHFTKLDQSICSSLAIYIYAHVVEIFNISPTDICSDFSGINYLSNRVIFSKLISEWPASEFKLNVLRYMLYAWVTKDGRYENTNLLKYLERLERYSINSESQSFDAEKWQCFILLLREIMRCAFESGCLSKQNSFFSSPKLPRSEKKKQWIPALKEQACIFKKTFEQISKRLEKKSVRESIEFSYEDLNEDFEVNVDEFLKELKELTKNIIAEIDGAINDDFQYILQENMVETSFSNLFPS